MLRKTLLPLVLALAAGGGLLFATTRPSGTGGEETEPSPPATPSPAVAAAPAALVDITEADLTSVLSPDSIPSIDDPVFISADEAGFLHAEEPVVALEIAGDARAYPLQIMTWHEIVNDEVGGTPVAVTYCPLCNTALVYVRVVNGTVLEFGTSGSLYNSALVMYDRQTDSKWLHFEGLAVIGELEGTQLEFIPVQIVSFEEFREQYPTGKVLSKETGFDRPYGTNPYDYYDTNERPFLFRGEVDPRLGAIARVVGVEVDGETAAYPYDVLATEAGAGAVHDTLGSTDIVVFWEAGVRSALDAPDIALARDVGSSGVFLPEAEGRRLTFTTKGSEIVDEETGSTWSLTGMATGGPLAGAQLVKLNHADTFWFAWAAHNPDTTIFEG